MKILQYEYVYLGGALAYFADLSFLNWEFYAILVPFTILYTIRNYKK